MKAQSSKSVTAIRKLSKGVTVLKNLMGLQQGSDRSCMNSSRLPLRSNQHLHPEPETSLSSL